jgi:hypothetical protein
MKPAARKPPAAASASVGAGSFDEMDMMSNDFGSIDLDGQSVPSTAANGSSTVESARPPPPPPSGTTLLLSDDGGKAAARRVADYGDAPAEWWKAPFYAYRVKMRQMDLRRDLASRRTDLVTAQRAVDDAFVALADRGRKLVTGKDAYAKLLVAVVAAEHSLRQRDGALAAETDAHTQKLGSFDARIAQHEAEAGAARAEQNALDDVFASADAIRQRADAKVKRVDIELRAAVARATPAGVPGGGGVSDEINAAVEARTAEREARLAELAQAMPAVTQATQNLTAARRNVTAIEQKILAAKNERAAIEAAFRRRGAAHGAEVAKAEEDVRAAMALLGRTAAADHRTFGSEWSEARRELAVLEKTATTRDDDVMLHVMALDADDHPMVRMGIGLAVGAIALLMLLALLPLAFRSAPPPVPTTIDVTR